jgi:hypothetical protein
VSGDFLAFILDAESAAIYMIQQYYPPETVQTMKDSNFFYRTRSFGECLGRRRPIINIILANIHALYNFFESRPEVGVRTMKHQSVARLTVYCYSVVFSHMQLISFYFKQQSSKLLSSSISVKQNSHLL